MCEIKKLMPMEIEQTAAKLRQTIQAKGSSLEHRRPDDGDARAEEVAGLALGHSSLKQEGMALSTIDPQCIAATLKHLSLDEGARRYQELYKQVGEEA